MSTGAAGPASWTQEANRAAGKALAALAVFVAVSLINDVLILAQIGVSSSLAPLVLTQIGGSSVLNSRVVLVWLIVGVLVPPLVLLPLGITHYRQVRRGEYQRSRTLAAAIALACGLLAFPVAVLTTWVVVLNGTLLELAYPRTIVILLILSSLLVVWIVALVAAGTYNGARNESSLTLASEERARGATQRQQEFFGPIGFDDVGLMWGGKGEVFRWAELESCRVVWSPKWALRATGMRPIPGSFHTVSHRVYQGTTDVYLDPFSSEWESRYRIGGSALANMPRSRPTYTTETTQVQDQEPDFDPANGPIVLAYATCRFDVVDRTTKKVIPLWVFARLTAPSTEDQLVERTRAILREYAGGALFEVRRDDTLPSMSFAETGFSSDMMRQLTEVPPWRSVPTDP